MLFRVQNVLWAETGEDNIDRLVSMINEANIYWHVNVKSEWRYVGYHEL